MGVHVTADKLNLLRVFQQALPVQLAASPPVQPAVDLRVSSSGSRNVQAMLAMVNRPACLLPALQASCRVWPLLHQVHRFQRVLLASAGFARRVPVELRLVPGRAMCLAGGPFIKKKTQGAESSAALPALHQAAGMGNRCGVKRMNCFTLWAACKHQVVVAERGLRRLSPVVGCSSSVSSVPLGCQELVTLKICLETGADPVFPVP